MKHKIIEYESHGHIQVHFWHQRTCCEQKFRKPLNIAGLPFCHNDDALEGECRHNVDQSPHCEVVAQLELSSGSIRDII